MFCDQCGRDIAGDSRYCAYCGSFLEKGAPEELDWEEAAHRREALEEAKDEKSGTLNSTIKNSRLSGQPGTQHCIRPNAPKKKCVDCGKELPSGGMEERCAMCVIRLRNRDLEQQREQQDSAPFRGDRYDKSDAFDQKVFEGVQYFRDGDSPQGEPEYRRYSGEEDGEKSSSARARWKSERKKSESWKVILFILLLFFGLKILPAVFYLGSETLKQVEGVWGNPGHISMDTAEEVFVSVEEEPEEEVGRRIYDQYISPYVSAYLSAAWETQYPQGYMTDLVLSYENFQAQGIYNEIQGVATFVTDDSEKREEMEVPYFISFVLMQDDAGSILVDVAKLELGEFFSLDLIPYMDSSGYISRGEKKHWTVK